MGSEPGDRRDPIPEGVWGSPRGFGAVQALWVSNPDSVAEISQETAVNPVDIVSTLQALQMLKYWKGKHLVLKRQVSLEPPPLGPFWGILGLFWK